MSANSLVRGFNPAVVWVVALCWVTITLDGYDLIVYGAVVPALLRDPSFGPLTPAEAGAIGGYALVGMLLGALTVGTITDLIGPRRIMLVCIAWFSLAMGLCALAPGPALLGLFRFLAGLGLGSVGTQILVNAYVAKHYPVGSRATARGWSLGIGRLGAITGPLLGGLVLSSALGLEWNYYSSWPRACSAP
jgi:MFS family permease